MNLQRLLGTALPIIQAPMAGVQDSALTIAVSNAGGLGSLPCAMLGPDAMRNELVRIKAQTQHPYNVNFFTHVPPVPDPAVLKTWLDRLEPYAAEFDVDRASVVGGGGRTPFDAAALEILKAFKPLVASFHFGLPAAHLLAEVRALGIRILASATTVPEAVWLERHGVDAVIAQGLEAGGHRGMFLSQDLSTQLGTFALVPRIVAAVSCPVIAAGGIADARGVRAALALGAAGVQVGTAYLLCPEATTSAIHRAAILSPAAGTTAVTNVFSGRPARAIVNRCMRELGPISADVPAFPLAAATLAPLRASAEARGSDDFSPLWCGQNALGCRAVTAAELTLDLARGLS